MHLILTGATGHVGSAALDAMLKMKDISKISILSRRPVPLAENDPRVNVIMHRDFNTYDDELLSKLKGANGAVWALGISQTKVSKEDYVTITKDYALAAAKAFADLAPGSEPFRFVYVSGEGATQEPGRFTAIFGRVKGETETALSHLREQYPRLDTEVVRPAGVDTTQHKAIRPYVASNMNPAYKAFESVLHPLIRMGYSSMHSPSEPLGKFLTEMAMGHYDEQLKVGASDVHVLPGGLRVVRNTAFRRFAGLSR